MWLLNIRRASFRDHLSLSSSPVLIYSVCVCVCAALVKDAPLSLKAASHFCVTCHSLLLSNKYKPSVTNRGDHVGDMNTTYTSPDYMYLVGCLYF